MTVSTSEDAALISNALHAANSLISHVLVIKRRGCEACATKRDVRETVRRAEGSTKERARTESAGRKEEIS